ncbi:MAG: hypothetical protein RL553_690 [Planctomycetota bacterium]|jgi:RND family efflux transporter MFP subunit
MLGVNPLIIICRHLFAIGLLLGISICLVGCDQKKMAPPAFPPPVVSVTKPVLYTVQNYHEYNGNLDAIETVHIQARVKGFLNEIAFTEGEEVKKGALLFKIDPREHSAAVKRTEADLRKATTEFERYRSEADRGSRLVGTRAVGTEDFEQRVAVRDTAAATMLQAQAALEGAKLQLSFAEIHSPINGQIGRALVTRGNLVGQNEATLLTTIVSMDPLFVYFDIPERDLVEFQRARNAGKQADVLSGSLPLEVGVTSDEGYPHAGKIDFRENKVDIGTGTVRMRGRIPNPRIPPGNTHLLYPGLYARVRVPSGDPRSLPAIPEDALMTGQEGRFVYVLGEGDVVQKRTVQVGPQIYKGTPVDAAKSQGWTLFAPATTPEGKDQVVQLPAVISIESGLTVNDRVVVNGLTKARPGTPVAPLAFELKQPASAGAK